MPSVLSRPSIPLLVRQENLRNLGRSGVQLVVPVPERESEVGVVDETAQNPLVEVDQHPVPWEEGPAVVQLEGISCLRLIQPPLKVSLFAEGAVSVPLSEKAPGIVSGQRVHSLVSQVILVHVLHIVGQLMRMPSHAQVVHVWQFESFDSSP